MRLSDERKGFDLVCRTCGNSSDLANVHMMVDYSLDEVTVFCLSCDSQEDCDVEEVFEGI